MTDSLLMALERPAPVGLAELEATAALLVRRDRKYIVPLPAAAELVERLDGGTRVLQIDGRRTFRYESVYFDTPDGASYLGAARRRPRRFKVRTRSYLDTGACLLELKTRSPRGRTVKVRREHPLVLRDRFGPGDRAFVAACPLVADGGATLEPALTTSYARATLLAVDGPSRLTIDTDVQARAPDGGLVVLVGVAIVETKSAGAPSKADRILWALGHRPVVVSKFGTSLAALRPDLPANKWTRALREPWLIVDGRERILVPRPDPVLAPIARRRPVLALAG